MRLFMLEKLKDRPWCVCELAAEVGIEKSVASKHLSQLRSAGLIEDEKRGTLVEYRLVAPSASSIWRPARKTPSSRAGSSGSMWCPWSRKAEAHRIDLRTGLDSWISMDQS